MAQCKTAVMSELQATATIATMLSLRPCCISKGLATVSQFYCRFPASFILGPFITQKKHNGSRAIAEAPIHHRGREHRWLLLLCIFPSGNRCLLVPSSDSCFCLGQIVFLVVVFLLLLLETQKPNRASFVCHCCCLMKLHKRIETVASWSTNPTAHENLHSLLTMKDTCHRNMTIMQQYKSALAGVIVVCINHVSVWNCIDSYLTFTWLNVFKVHWCETALFSTMFSVFSFFVSL